MRAVSRELFACLNSEAAQPVDLLEIRLQASGVAYEKRFTNAGHDVVISGKTYTSIPFSRGTITEELITRGGVGKPISVAVSNINGDLARILNKVQLDGASATFSTTDRRLLNRTPSVPPMVIARGTVRNVQLGGRVGSFEIETVASTIDCLMGPKRILQRKCNYQFGSIECGVDITVSPNTISTNVLAGSTKNFVVINSAILDLIPDREDRNGVPVVKDPSEFWSQGSVYALTGDNAASWRPFAKYQDSGGQHRLWVQYPFAYDFVANDDIRLVRGCAKTKQACFERQGDALSYGGFEEISRTSTFHADILQID